MMLKLHSFPRLQEWLYKIVTIVLVIALLPLGSVAQAQNGVDSALPSGDVDGNGVVGIEDARLVNQYVVGQIDSLPHPENADATEDGEITIEDALAIVQRVNGRSHVTVVGLAYGLPGKIYPGSPVRIEVFERFFPSEITSGTIRIKSPNTGYDSGDIPLIFEDDKKSLYYHLDTSALTTEAGYEVWVKLERLGNPDEEPIEPDSSISLSARVFEIPYLAQVQDAYAPAQGIPLDFVRTFSHDSAHVPYLGPFGRGWTHTFNAFLEEFTDGLIAFFGPNGFNRWFVSNGDGTYTASPGDYGVLIRNNDGNFQLRGKGGLIYGFRSDLRLDYIQDPNGNRASCIYNGNNQLIEISHSNGLSIHLEYNAHGRISKLIDHAGRETVYEYSPDGVHLLKVTNPAGYATSYTYSLGMGEATDHRLTSIAYPDGTHIFYAYDPEGRLTFIERDGGTGHIGFSYDADGTTYITDAAGGKTTVHVNEYGQTTEVVDPMGAVTRYEYDANHNLAKVTTPLNRIYLFEYDERGNVVQVTDPMGYQVHVGYEPSFSKVAWLRDSLGRTTTFAYNQQGNPTASTYPDGSTERYAYDENYFLKSKTNRDGQIIDYTFDNRGLLLSKTYPDGTSLSYSYDSVGMMTSTTDSTGTTSFEYDLIGRLIQVTYPGNRVFKYQYDNMGKRIRMTDPDGNILNYKYDSTGRLVEITDDSKTTIVEYQYDNADRLTRKILGNGAYATYEYDASGQILKLVNYGPTDDVISYFYYTYDAAGNRLSKETIEGTESYTYDALNQLTSVMYPDGITTEFVYDAMGNRLTVTDNGTVTGYTVNELNQYTSVDGTTYEYDLNGNLISRNDNGQTTYYDYDFENQLIGVQTPGETINYTYNAFGLRNSRSDSEGTVRYLWDGNQVALDESEAHQTIAGYVWGDALDEIIRMERGGNTYYYIQDAMLSVSDLMDTSGNVVEHYQYQVFGKPLATSSVGNPWLYTGLAYDFETGLQYNRFRYYASSLGRFISPDPINVIGGLNLYSYALNAPTYLSDPEGCMVFAPIVISIGIWILVGIMTLNLIVGYPTGAIPPSGLRGGATATDLMYRVKQLNKAEAVFEIPWSGWPLEEGGGGGICPTFIQLPPNMESTAIRPTHLDVSYERLAAKITVPVDNCLLRSDIPIFGVAGGTNFKEYRVEYGEGENPIEWHLIESSTTPQPTTDIGIAEIQLMQGDIDIRGNLATWNTGLKNWVHLPWHPPEDPTDFNGVYTIRLVVEGNDGETVEDKVTCEVGRVIAQCLPSIAISPDERVVMRFPEQSLTEPFRVYTILPLDEVGEELLPQPEGTQLIGQIYRIREPGDRFIKDVALEFNVSKGELQRYEAGHLGIIQYDVEANEWLWLATLYSLNTNSGIFSTTLTELPTSKAIYALGYDPQSNRSQPQADSTTIESQTPISHEVLIYDTFEDSTGGWKSRDHFVGGVVNRVKAASDGSYALQIASQSSVSNFAVTILDQPFDISDYPVMSFDYRIAPGIKTDFYLLVNGRWYNLGFTDEPNDFRNRDVNIANLGQLEGIVADDQWHSTSVNLYELLHQKTRNTCVDAIIMADWDISGYMKLEFGRNDRGGAYYVDNFKLAAGPEYDFSDILVLDNFDSPGATNLFGGTSGTFSSSEAAYCKTNVVEDITTINNHVLEIDFDVTISGSYSGYLTSLMDADIGNMKEVSLRLYAPETVPPMLLGLRCSRWVETKVLVQPYLSPPDEDGWRSLIIPLSAFRGLPEPPDALFITFENKLFSGAGTILIDDIHFCSHPSSGKVVDFDVHDIEQNLLGGVFNTIAKEAAVISTGYYTDRTCLPEIGTARISYGGSIGLDYGGGRFSYAIWETALLGFDARGFQNIVIKVRGENGGEKPNIWLDDGTTRRPVRAKEFAPITTSWQEIYIPLEKFIAQGVDLSHLEAIQIVFEWEEMSGTVYIAEIRFE
jgi:RHS repeat-associated protein